MTVVIHSFVADSSLLDCCDLVVCFLCVFPPYACSWQPFGFFEVVSTVLFLSFGVSCLLAQLVQPFFICHLHLWFGLSFFTIGICGLFFHSLPQAFVYGVFLSRPFLP